MAKRISSRTLNFAAVLIVSLITQLLSMHGGAGMVVAAEGGDNRKVNLDPASTNYIVLDRNPKTGQERFFCLARGRCRFKVIQCPTQCPQRKPKKNRVVKGCFADCSSRCETTCKRTYMFNLFISMSINIAHIFIISLIDVGIFIYR